MNAETRIRYTAGEETYLRAFAERRRDLPGFIDQRAASIDLLARHGLPTRRVEAWKFSDLRAAIKDAPPPAFPASATDIAAAASVTNAFAGVSAVRLVFVNGTFVPGLSDSAMPHCFISRSEPGFVTRRCSG